MWKRTLVISLVFGFVITTVLSTIGTKAGILDCLSAGANFDFSVLEKGECKPRSGQNSGSSTAGARPQTNAYYALGDSVAAGLGLPAGSETSTQDRQCGRSSQAYGSQVAAASGLPYTNLACSGATAGDLLTDQHISGSNPEQQFKSAFANGTPKLITITAGANDVQWAQFVRLCLATDCNNRTNSAVAAASADVLRAKLHAAFSYIQLKSGNNPPQVIITGYYNPLSAPCVQQFPQLTSYELSWLNSGVSRLNSTISRVASQYPFVKYAPVNFVGHELCTASPWVQGINDAAPLHPTAAGQQAIARSVINRL